MERSPFRAAVEAGDIEAATALLAQDVVFRSPAVFTPYAGKEKVTRILQTVFGVFEDFTYVDELASQDGTHALIFTARVGEKELQGLDWIRTGPDGLITEFTVMVRPASGLMALATEMGARLATP